MMIFRIVNSAFIIACALLLASCQEKRTYNSSHDLTTVRDTIEAPSPQDTPIDTTGIGTHFDTVPKLGIMVGKLRYDTSQFEGKLLWSILGGWWADTSAPSAVYDVCENAILYDIEHFKNYHFRLHHDTMIVRFEEGLDTFRVRLNTAHDTMLLLRRHDTLRYMPDTEKYFRWEPPK